MLNISKVADVSNKVVDTGIKKPLNAFSKTKIADWACKPENFGKMAITSIVLKDGIGCAMYVNQSLNNKDIPDDKRKFVAALDLTNGGLMILAQLGTYFTISNPKVQSQIFGKLFGKNFDDAAKSKCEEVIKKLPKYKDKAISPKEFEEIFGKFKGDIKGFFGVFTGIVAATIVAKRIIVPFIATPLADKAKVWMNKDEDKDKDKDKDKDTFKSQNK